MKAVHFGAGNIGRGFIGALLRQSGYDVVFVDVDARIIHELNTRRAYEVKVAEQTVEPFTVEGIRGLNSRTDEPEVIEEIASADLITTAVGVAVLKFVAAPIAAGLVARKDSQTPLNIIACENAIGASTMLQEYVRALLTKEEWLRLKERVGFPNAAVDRIVPNQGERDLLSVTVEPYYEWVVDETAINGPAPSIHGVTYVKDLLPYIERKLFTVNTGHAMTAYLGFKQGMKTIQEAIHDEPIASRVRQALSETTALLADVHGFSEAELRTYAEKIWLRFRNPHLSDRVERVGRNPIRKLGYNDRLVKPARLLLDRGYEPQALVQGIVAALAFDVSEDEESVRLQKMLSENGVELTIVEVTGLKRDDELVKRIVKSEMED